MEFDTELRKALAEAQRYLDELPAPPNEANTCDWVIRPLIVALGYANHEIFGQSADTSNKFPDYTILPNTNSTWYLEAKAWKSVLESSHVDQAMNYAHSNGKRWVVLSNGKEWRLYDDTIVGKSADRLVAMASLDDQPEMLKFLSALSKKSVSEDKVGDFAAEKRIKEYIFQEIQNPKGPVISAIVKVVKSALTGVTVSGDTVVSILNSHAFQTVASPTTEPVSKPIEVPTVASQSSSTVAEGVFICIGVDASGYGLYLDGGILVQKGSRIRKAQAPTSPPSVAKLISNLVTKNVLTDVGECYELLEDEFFSSPSSAASFVLGRSANGWISWKLPNGTLLDQFREK